MMMKPNLPVRSVRIPRTLRALAFASLAATAILMVVFLPEWQAARLSGELTVREAEDLTIEYRRTVLQAIGGGLIGLGLWITWRRLKVIEDGQVTDRFTKALDLLRDEQPSARLGAIYALERIAKDSEKDHWPVMEILTAFIRERSPWNKPVHNDNDIPEVLADLPAEPSLAPDVQAALTVIGRREHIGTEQHSIDLSRTDLSGATLPPGLNFRNVRFTEANLHKANFSRCDLTGADFTHTLLTSTVFREAVLDLAKMVSARFGGTYLQGASTHGLIVAETQVPRLDGLSDEQKTELRLAREQWSEPLVVKIAGTGSRRSKE